MIKTHSDCTNKHTQLDNSLIEFKEILKTQEYILLYSFEYCKCRKAEFVQFCIGNVDSKSRGQELK